MQEGKDTLQFQPSYRKFYLISEVFAVLKTYQMTAGDISQASFVGFSAYLSSGKGQAASAYNLHITGAISVFFNDLHDNTMLLRHTQRSSL